MPPEKDGSSPQPASPAPPSTGAEIKGQTGSAEEDTSTEVELDIDLDELVEEEGEETLQEAPAATASGSGLRSLPPPPMPELWAATGGPDVEIAAPFAAPVERRQLITVAEALAGLAGDEGERVARLERELVHETDMTRLAVLEHEIGWLLESRAGDPQSAMESYTRAMVADPTLKPALWNLRRHLEARSLHEHLLELLERELEGSQLPSERAQLRVDRGHLLEDRLGRDAEAGEEYRAAIAEDPACLPALMALEGLAVRQGDTEALLHVYRQLADATR